MTVVLRGAMRLRTGAKPNVLFYFYSISPYQIVVTPKLGDGKAVWDSGRVESNSSNLIEYRGTSTQILLRWVSATALVACSPTQLTARNRGTLAPRSRPRRPTRVVSAATGPRNLGARNGVPCELR